uniref:Uncharacterized protein n=1 Tax=Oryza brachyantha TaxID=4533 RepID=J3MBG9_ORYBR
MVFAVVTVRYPASHPSISFFMFRYICTIFVENGFLIYRVSSIVFVSPLLRGLIRSAAAEGVPRLGEPAGEEAWP